MTEKDHSKALENIFKSLRETSSVEFKENFSWGNKDKYMKTMVSFANHKGGYLIFGVADEPRKLVGLTSAHFETQDEAKITSSLNGTFSPEVNYEKFTFSINSKNVGVIYTHKSQEGPVVAIKNDGEIKESEIYYRYNARNDKIKYPELRKVLESIRQQERLSWMNLFKNVSKSGPSNVAVLDIIQGTVKGDRGSALIDEKLIPKLQFIKEGNFTEKGKPTLKLIGDVKAVQVSRHSTLGKTALRITDDPSALAVREETILKEFPMGYFELLKKLKARYSDFKSNNHFNSIKRNLMQNSKFCRTRYLDPNKSSGSKKDFYSEKIIKEFDKHYTKKRTNKKSSQNKLFSI